MKLTEFILELEKKQATLANKDVMEKIAGGNGFILGPNDLKNFERQLFECEEFKNVARINYIDSPTFFIDEETGEPISSNREFLGGKLKTNKVDSFTINQNQEIKFNKIIDIYSVTVNKKFLTKEEVSKPGIWIYPTTYDVGFEPTNQIKVIWDPNQLEEALRLIGNKETPKNRLMRMFESALDTMEPNVPCEYVLTIRCSERSVVNANEFLKDDIIDGEPVKSILYDGMISYTGQTELNEFVAHSVTGTI